MNINVSFWYMRPCKQGDVHRRFGGTYCLHLQDLRENRARKRQPEPCNVCVSFYWPVLQPITLILNAWSFWHQIEQTTKQREEEKNAMFWNITQWNLAEFYRGYGGSYCLRVQGRGVRCASKQQHTETNILKYRINNSLQSQIHRIKVNKVRGKQ
jgi:hypothetical protein